MNPDDPRREPSLHLLVPAPDPVARDCALYHATVALRAARLVEPAPVSRWPALFAAHRRGFAGAAAALVLLAALGVAFTFRPSSGQGLPTPTAERGVLSEMEVLFGSQLDAVIERPDGPPDIRLSADSANSAPPSLAQPVLIEFHRLGRETTRVLSYSGRDVCVMLAGRRTCFEPLVTGGGEVILSGERFYWNSHQPASELDGYRVIARPLPHS